MAARKNNTTRFLPPGELQKAREATSLRGTAGISLQIVTIVVIYIYSCYLQLFMYLFIFIDKINLFECCSTSKLYIYCHFLYLFYIYSLFIENLIYYYEL